jgi:hypothetical protein
VLPRFPKFFIFPRHNFLFLRQTKEKAKLNLCRRFLRVSHLWAVSVRQDVGKSKCTGTEADLDCHAQHQPAGALEVKSQC